MNLDYLWNGFTVALTLQNLLIGLAGCFIGTWSAPCRRSGRSTASRC